MDQEVAIAWVVGYLCGQIRCPKRPHLPPGPSVAAWVRLTGRALRFIRKGRLVSLAFSNCRHTRLRQASVTAKAAASRSTRRRTNTPAAHQHASGSTPSPTRRAGPAVESRWIRQKPSWPRSVFWPEL